MTWIILMVFALCLSVFALKWMNLLLAIVASTSWFALLAYNVNYPPSNITQGSNVDSFVIWAIAIVAITIPIITISRMRGRTTANAGSVEGDELKPSVKSTPSVSNMTTEEYRAYVRGRVRRGR